MDALRTDEAGMPSGSAGIVDAVRTRLLSKLACLALGMIVTFPILLPVGANVRSTDVLSLGCLALFVMERAGRRSLDSMVGPLALVMLLSLEWVGAELWNSGLHPTSSTVQVVLLRWMLAIFTALYVRRAFNRDATRGWVAYGMALGVALGLASIAVDAWTFDPLATLPGLDLEDIVYIDGVYRARGMFSHPNEAAGVIMLIAPILIGLVEERRLPRFALLMVVAAAVCIFMLTKSRSQVVVAMLLLVLWAARDSRRMFIGVLMAGAVAAAALVVATSAISAIDDAAVGRIADVGLSENVNDRSNTVLASVEIVLGHPFGLGSAYEGVLEEATGFASTHNAFLQLALMGGIPLTALVIFQMVKTGGRLRHMSHRMLRPLEAWIAAYLAMIFMAENYFFVPSISILTLWACFSTAGKHQPTEDLPKA